MLRNLQQHLPASISWKDLGLDDVAAGKGAKDTQSREVDEGEAARSESKLGDKAPLWLTPVACDGSFSYGLGEGGGSEEPLTCETHFVYI